MELSHLSVKNFTAFGFKEVLLCLSIKDFLCCHTCELKEDSCTCQVVFFCFFSKNILVEPLHTREFEQLLSFSLVPR